MQFFIDREKTFWNWCIRKKYTAYSNCYGGHYWSELAWYKKNNIQIISKKALPFGNGIKLQKRIFAEAEIILPICKYLEKITNEHVPNQKTDVFFEGIDASQWYKTNGMKLKHPCVGLVQRANWWGKNI